MNPKNLEVNSKWTALQTRLGWRHFRIVRRSYRADDGALQIELMAACDRAARLWIDAEQLHDKTQFIPGWQRTGLQ